MNDTLTLPLTLAPCPSCDGAGQVEDHEYPDGPTLACPAGCDHGYVPAPEPAEANA